MITATFGEIMRERDEAMRRLAIALAENARLKAAMDRYSEDEALGNLRGELLLSCCIEICQEESTDNGTAQKIEARIRELKEEKNEQPPPKYTAEEQRMMGQPHCPKCLTFGYTHRIGCVYEMDGMDRHIRNGVMK
jgi:hypothetical protein